MLAGSDTDKLIAQFAHGEPLSDLQLISRLASLMVAALKAPVPDERSFATFAAVLGDANSVEAEAAAEAEAAHARAAETESNVFSGNDSTLSSVHPTTDTDPAGTSRGDTPLQGGGAPGEPVHKVHAAGGSSRTPVSWPGATTAGSFRYRVF